MKNKTSKIVSALYFLCIVTCILLSAHLVSDVAARFKTEASGSGSARVAKWDVQVTDTDQTLNFNESKAQVDAQTLTYNFTVTNNSEVAMEFFVKVSFDKPMPTYITLKLDSGEEIVCNGTNEYTFTTGIQHAPGEEKSHTLSVVVNYITDGKLVDFSDFSPTAEISIIAEQVD